MITANWEAPAGYQRLARWQIRVLVRWAAEDAAAALDATPEEVEPRA